MTLTSAIAGAVADKLDPARNHDVIRPLHHADGAASAPGRVADEPHPVQDADVVCGEQQYGSAPAVDCRAGVSDELDTA
eukprot:1200054-Rhodomonas_salina.2